MSEAEIISELGFRAEMTWNITQWWVSICFAVMVATYLGSRKLTKPIVALIIGLYALTTARALLALSVHTAYVFDLYEALRILSETEQLTVVGTGALERQDSPVQSFLSPLWLAGSMIFTVSFVVYCYRHVRESG